MSGVMLDVEGLVRRHAAWMTISAGVAGIINFLYAILAAWLLPIGDYPKFGAGQALLIVCGTVAGASVPWVLSQRLLGGNPAGRHEAVTFAVAITFAQSVIFSLAVGVISAGFANGWEPWATSVSAFLIFAASPTFGYMQGLEQFGRISVLRVLEASLRLVSGALLMYTGGGVTGGLGSFAVGSLMVVLVAGPPLVREIRFGFAWLRDQQLWREAVGLGLVQGGLALLASIDVIEGSLFTSHTAELSGYQVAVILSRVPFYLAISLSAVAFTRMVAEPNSRRRVIRSSMDVLDRTSIPIVVSVATLPLPIATLFLPSSYTRLLHTFTGYTTATGALIAVSVLVVTYYQAEARFLRCIRILLLGLAVDALLNLVGLQVAGVHGLARSNLVGQLCITSMLLVGGHRLWGRAVLPGPWLLVTAAASLPLLYLQRMPVVWLVYGVVLTILCCWDAFIRRDRTAGIGIATGAAVIHNLSGRMQASAWSRKGLWLRGGDSADSHQHSTENQQE